MSILQTESSSAYSGSAINPNGGMIQSPDLKSVDSRPNRAIRDWPQLKSIVQTVVSANRERQIVNSRITAKYNAERPYNQRKLEDEGLGWRSNFTTKPLPSMIEKVYPRFVDAIQNLKYLTAAELSADYENATEKTEAFRDGITKLIRARAGWRTFLESVAQENALFGYNVVAWLDEFGWFPTMPFQQNEIFLHDGCKQDVEMAQIVVLKEVYLPHEVFAYIKDKEEAKEAGWLIENTIEVINKASPTQDREIVAAGATSEAWYQNAIRDMTLGSSYVAGASVIQMYSILVREVTGKVSHYRIAGEGMKLVFEKEDRFDKMEDCLAFFSFQKGNGHMHGSKGIGREIYELAGIVDRTRNELVDRAILSGKTFVQGDLRNLSKLKMSVVGAMVIVPDGWNFLEAKVDGNVEPFLKLDAYIGMLVDALIGSVSPPRIEGEAFRSPQAWALMAQREEEGRDAKIARFMEQFAKMVQTMQRRICSASIEDDDAKAFQKQMLKKMTREELDILAKSPVAGTVRDLTPTQRQMISILAAEKKGNPLYNQRALEVEDVTARVTADFAKKVILPENDPTVQAEQSRLQQMELALIMQGQPVPVSPRDNHEIHLSIIMPVAEQVGAAVNSGEADTATFEALVAHIAEHYERALQSGADKAKIKPVGDFLKKALPAIDQLKQLDQQAGELGAATQAHDEEEMNSPI